MLELRGAPALSPFRSRKLHSRIQEMVPGVEHVYAEFMHFVDLDADLSDSEQAILDRLLTYGPSVQVEEPDGILFLVVPRPGTLSPWSSHMPTPMERCTAAQSTQTTTPRLTDAHASLRCASLLAQSAHFVFGGCVKKAINAWRSCFASSYAQRESTAEQSERGRR